MVSHTQARRQGPVVNLEEQLRAELDRIREQGLYRQTIPARHEGGGRIRVGGADFLNLASNDYLGLACDPDLLAEFYARLDPAALPGDFGPGSTASRLMTGNHGLYQRLEEGLAGMYSRPRALVFNSGYHCNIGILPALAGRQDLVLADKLCHASLIDGMRLCRARVIRYPHLDYDRLQALLEEHRPRHRQVFLVTESIFSMDGDLADLRRLVRLKEAWQAVLYVDEAHAVGTRGSRGLGLAGEQGVVADIDLLVGTFGKAWGGQGAWLLCRQTVADYLVNTARSLIFTTALPPVSLAWLCFLLPRIQRLERQRRHLRDLAARLRRELGRQGLATRGESNIVPVMIGDAARAVATAEALRRHGFWVNAVRPPTVPAGTARLRISLTAAMDWQQLAPLPGLIASILRGG